MAQDLELSHLLAAVQVLDQKCDPSWIIACLHQSPDTRINSNSNILTIQIFLILVVLRAVLLPQLLLWLLLKPLLQSGMETGLDQLGQKGCVSGRRIHP
tara:strand:- start:382 stop:678 length:297 start_codon:yes stop_codon:yes gene_type:complete